MSNAKHSPDLLFEVSWEVCNKVGGIHTVISTKAQTVTRKFADRYVLLGPDLSHEGVNPEFEEDPNLLKAWRQSLYNEGIRVRVGRWKIKGEPTVVLVDFSSLIPRKDEILKSLWESYHVDSISGQWDYIEPVLFGWAAGVVIASYVETFGTPTEKAVAHFHEWMTAAGGLYLRKHAPYIATVFTTHATVMGRCIAGNRLPLYNDLPKFNADELARQFNVTAKHSIEKMAAAYHDAFLTVSDITANECKYLLGREPDGVTPNGFENDFVWAGEEYYAKRDEARRAMISVAEACLGEKFTGDPLIVGTSGRYEFRNKGIDVFIESLKQLAASDRLRREVLAYITVPAGNRGPRLDLQAHLADPSKPIDAGQYRHSTHYLENATWDPIVNALKNSNLTDPGSKVKVIFVPTYLNKADGIFHKDYYELLVGMDITVFPSYYEPWGYTPLESVAFSIPTVTTTLAGFGIWVDKQREHAGVEVIRRDDYNDKEVEAKIADTLLRFSLLDEKHVNEQHTSAYEISLTALWEHLFAAYEQAYSEAVESSIVRTNRAVLDGGTKTEQINFVRQQLFVEKPVWNRMMVDKTLPKRLHALEELSRNLSQEVNGVSWLHGEVSKEILGNMWPGYFKNELHIGYVTNGVHFPTWIASSLRRLYARYFGDGFEGHVYDIPAWQKVHDIPDAELWEERMKLKNKLIKHIRRRYSDPRQVRLDSPRQMLQVIEGIKPDVLTIGFARRFATYKRAYLLFTNLDRLAAIVNNKERPVQFIFAGKAHPNDKPGQDLIRRIVEVAAMPQFVGKILFLQNYDMELARRMVQGVDVWLNTPTRPLEASGTSGEKCVMNGVLQFSVLDGWWVEGYKEGAGWMLPMERTFADQHYQDELDAEMIYNTIEEQIAPKYSARDTDGIPHERVSSVKRCVADIASNFTTNRMLTDYENRFYDKLAARKREMSAEAYRMAREIAAWKRKVSALSLIHI